MDESTKKKRLVYMLRPNGHREFERRISFLKEKKYPINDSVKRAVLETMIEDGWVQQMSLTTKTMEELKAHKESLGYTIEDVREVIRGGSDNGMSSRMGEDDKTGTIKGFFKSAWRLVKVCFTGDAD